MTKADVVTEIAKNTGMDREEVSKVVESFMETIKTSMAEGKNIYLRGFGSFVVKERAEKTARNISKKTTIIIPKHNVPTFKPSKMFSSVVK